MGAAQGDETMTDADRVDVWLASADGRVVVDRELRRSGLPGAFDADLVRMVSHGARQMVHKGDVIESVPAWATHTMRLRAMDLLKSPSFRRVEALDEAAVSEVDSTADDDVAEIIAALELTDIRRSLAARTHEAWEVSASLTYLAVALEGAVPASHCPTPADGAGADDLTRAHWAALFYAGQLQCFGESRSETPTIRQRRKRRIDQTRAALAEAWFATHAEVDRG